MKVVWIEVCGFDGMVFCSCNMSCGEIYFLCIGVGWIIIVCDVGVFEWYFGDDVYVMVGEDV